MANKSRSKGAEQQASSYKANKRWETNRKARLERTIKAQPNNEQAKLALKGMVYRRKTPVTRVWSASWVRVAKIFKEFTGRFDPAIMSSNPEVAKAALARPGPKTANYVPLPVRDMFSLGTRAMGN